MKDGRGVALLIWPLLLPLVTSCGGDSTGPDVVRISGNYTYSFGLGNAAVNLSCQGAGQISISQQGAQFSGQGNGQVFCTGPGGQLPGAGEIEITGGEINGRQVSFRFPLFEATCNATGTASGDPVNNLSGPATCSLAVFGQTIQLTGNWQASR